MVEAVFGGAEGDFGFNLVAAAAGFFELALDGGDQAGEVLFGDVVLGARAHGVDGGLLGDGAGEHDEGNVEAGGFEQRKGFGAAEVGEVVVGEDDVGQRAG